MSPLPLFVDGDLVVFRCVVQKEKHLTAVDGRGLKMAGCMYMVFLEGGFSCSSYCHSQLSEYRRRHYGMTDFNTKQT